MASSSPERMFPVQLHFRTRTELSHLVCPTSVPWAFMEQFEKTVVRNHSQTLEQLAPRAGLSACEVMAAATNVSIRTWLHSGEENAIVALKVAVAEWKAQQLCHKCIQLRKEVDAACALGGDSLVKLIRVLAALEGQVFSEGVPKGVLCDGCNSFEPHEHRCHGDRPQVSGESVPDAVCVCKDCHPSPEELAAFRKELEAPDLHLDDDPYERKEGNLLPCPMKDCESDPRLVQDGTWVACHECVFMTRYKHWQLLPRGAS